MALIIPCPRCQNPLEIPQPPPEQIRCGRCGVVINTKVQETVTAAAPAASIAVAAQAPPTQASGSRLKVGALAVLLGGGLLVCLLPIAGLTLAWILSGSGAEKKPGDDEVEAPKAEIESPKTTKPPPPDPRLKIVQPAVDKGVAYLKANVPKIAGQGAAYAGLCGLALLECGVAPDDPAILKMAETIRASGYLMSHTYGLAASLFFLNRWDESRPLDEKDRKLAKSLALRLIDGQLTTGIWSYGGGSPMGAENEAKLLARLQAGTYKPTSVAVPSMSNTQFAMLAVWGARKHGVPVREPLLALAAYFHANQQAEGSWNYPGNSLKATSTCAGLISLAIEVALLEDKEFARNRRQPDDARKKADVDKAFAFVAKTIGRKLTDPGAPPAYGGRLFNADAGGDLYFLWTLERVGVIYSKNVIGGKDWYDWGYPIVMKAQQPDGSWNEAAPTLSGGPLSDTCFALLFLKRANIARDLTEIIRTRGGKEAIP